MHPAGERRHRFSPDMDGDGEPDTMPNEATYTGSLSGVAAGDVVHAQWTHEEGGASWDAATVVEFEVHATASVAGCGLPPAAWTWVPDTASEVQPMVDAYDCLVCAFQNWPTFSGCGVGSGGLAFCY